MHDRSHRQRQRAAAGGVHAGGPPFQVHMFNITDRIAYFSMEIGLDTAIPTYSGGLGVLAGDTLRADADLGLPLVAVTLLHRHVYLRQHLDAAGNQSENPVMWVPEEVLEPMSPCVTIAIEGRSVQVCAWRYVVRGVFEHTVPVYLLDTTDQCHAAIAP
jgi:glycogen phosphorylase